VRGIPIHSRSFLNGILPTQSRRKSPGWLVWRLAGGGWLVAAGWLAAGWSGSWRLYTLANFEESEQRGGRLVVGGWLVAGSWRLCTLANFEESAGWRLAGGWELASLHSCQL
jgi:hypothetical protein